MITEKEDDKIKIALNDKEIDELIIKLEGLKEDKEHIHFSFDKDHELLIHHEKGELK